MPKRSHKVLPLSKKEKVLNFNKERKNHILKSLRFTVRTNCSVTSVKLQKRKKKKTNNNVLILLSHLKLKNLQLQCMMCLVKVEKAFNL